jgi:hypothetical protein
MLVFIWLLAGFCVLLWSLAAWGLNALLTADPQWVADLGEFAAKVPFGAWIDRWVPGWQDLLQLALDMAQSALDWVGDAAPLVVWVTWGAGTAVMLLGAVLLTTMVLILRPARSGGATAT